MNLYWIYDLRNWQIGLHIIGQTRGTQNPCHLVELGKLIPA
jgi:hypothetical protein